MRKDEAYNILNLNHGADEKTVKKAYRRAAAKYHPDKHHGKDETEIKENESKFKEIKLAYEVLTGKVQEPQSHQGFGGSYSNFQDMFAEAEKQRREAMMNGQNIEIQTHIDIKLAIHGGKTNITIPVFDICKECDGTGVVLDEVNQGFGAQKYCHSCGGRGNISSKKDLNMNIPKNTKSGARFRMMGKGGPRRSPDGKDGVLFVVVVYKDDDYFKNIHHGLCVEAYVPLDVWIIGGSVYIATPTGKVTVEVPALIPSDKLLRIAGKGVGGNDIFVSIKVDNNYFKDSDIESIIKDLGKSLRDKHISKDVDNFNLKTKNKLRELK